MTKEEIILLLVAAGELEIDGEGRIWRLKKRHGKPRQRGQTAYRKGVGLSDCKRVRAEYPTKDGYLLIATTIDGVKTVTGAHRVVYQHFKGPIPKGLTINHEDGIKSRNHPDNLEPMTYSEQRHHAINVLNVNRNRPKGSKHPKTKITEADVAEIRRMRMGGMPVIKIALKYEMKPRAISAICTRKTWTHVS